LKLEARFFTAAALCLVFYFIAANVGSGWIYLLSAALLTILFVSIIAPLIMINSLRVTQDLPSFGVAGQTLDITIHINSARWFPAYWLKVSYEFPAKQKRNHPQLPVVIDCLSGKRSLTWTINHPVRGVQPAGQVVITSCFPIGFAWVQKVFPSGSQNITIYPHTVALDGFFLYKLNPSGSGSGGAASGSRSVRQSTYTRGVRDYVRGDSPRIVHWASRARTGTLLVREFEAEGFPQFDVLLDLEAAWENAAQFELAVTTAGSLLNLGYRLGIGPKFICHPDLESLTAELPAIPPGIQYELEILARVQPLENDANSTTAAYAASNADRSLIVIKPAGQASPPVGSYYAVDIAARAIDQSDSGVHRLDFRRPGVGGSTISREADLEQL